MPKIEHFVLKTDIQFQMIFMNGREMIVCGVPAYSFKKTGL